MYWAIDLEFVRIAISQEVPPDKSNKRINGKLFKKITGGEDTIVARRNYDRTDTHLKIDSTFLIMGNDPIKVDTPDAFEHCLEFSSSVRFVSQDTIDSEPFELIKRNWQVGDPNVKMYCNSDDWKLATVKLLFDSYSPTACKIVREDDLEEDEDDTHLNRLILQNYDITGCGDDMIPVKQILADLNCSKKKIVKEMTALGISKRQNRKHNEYRDMQCFFGIKKMPTPEPESEPQVSLNN
jgi:hypothetical protein